MPKGTVAEWAYSSPLSLTSALGGWVVNATPLPFYPQEWLGTHYIEGWVSPTQGLGGCGKSRFHRNSIPAPSSLQQVVIAASLRGASFISDTCTLAGACPSRPCLVVKKLLMRSLGFLWQWGDRFPSPFLLDIGRNENSVLCNEWATLKWRNPVEMFV